MTEYAKDTPDADLTTLIRNADAGALKALYFRYSEPLYGFLWRKTRNAEVAKDLVQDIFIRVWEGRNNLDPGQSIKAYLYRIANNLAIDHLRKKISIQKHIEENTGAEPSQQPDMNFDLKDHINLAVESLPEAQRNVFTLSRYDGLKYSEIAATLNISTKTVENHMNRALKKLREKLQHLLSLLFFWYF